VHVLEKDKKDLEEKIKTENQTEGDTKQEEFEANESGRFTRDDDSAESEASTQENVSDLGDKLEIKKLQDELHELKDSYTRLQAEYANHIRRTKQEKDALSLFANEKIMSELIPVIDSMERALDACDDKENNMYKGIELVHKQLIDALAKSGLEPIEAMDQDFDPNFHLAITQESVEGVEPDKVIMELQKGYKLGTKVIRPSMVKVSN
jgi:molecular chaperone GrpE